MIECYRVGCIHHQAPNGPVCYLNECNFKLLCGGACQARHFAETGSIDKAGDFCEYEKNAIVDGLIASSFP